MTRAKEQSLSLNGVSQSAVERAERDIEEAMICLAKRAEEIGTHPPSWKELAKEAARAALATQPTSDTGLRPEVLAFAQVMERELRANDHKPGWKGDGLGPLTDRVLEEAGELERAVIELLKQVVWADEPSYGSRGGNGWSRRNPATGANQVGVGYREMAGEERRAQLARIISEAADVGNMAMMVADVARTTLETTSDEGGEKA